MILLPKEKPILDRLNSYYLKIPKLVEHFQGEIGYGLVHLRSATAEGSLIFDKDETLNAVYQERDTGLVGQDAVAAIGQIDENASYGVSVYGIHADQIYYWSVTPNAKRIYQNLSTEFTDLEALVKKMGNEELTGIIDVVIGDGREGGLLLLNAGRVVGGSYSWRHHAEGGDEEDQQRLIQQTKRHSGTFHVCRLPSNGGETASGCGTEVPFQGSKPGRIQRSIEELLGIFERVCDGRKSLRNGFPTLLNRKFVEKADEFLFLDPFAGEFKYANGKISVLPEVPEGELWTGVTGSVSELAHELGLASALQENLVAWKKKYNDEIARLGGWA
jgi:hypothetical protein